MWRLEILLLLTMLQTGGDSRPTFTVPVPSNQELGVIVQDITPQIAAAFGLKQDRGAVVTALDAGTLQPGDVILSVNGQNVGSRRGLQNLLAAISPADTLIFQVSRNGATRDIVVQRTADAAASENQTVPTTIAPGFRGVRVVNLSGGPFGAGVVVTEVEKGTPAEAAGLSLGDIIVDVNHLPVQSVDQFLDHMQKLSGHRVNLGVVRQGIYSLVVVPSLY